MNKNDEKGRAWAERVYAEKLESGRLPNLGRGFSREKLAARAVQSIADKKLFAGVSRHATSLRTWERAFWRGVLDWSNEKGMESDHPAEWAAAYAWVLKFTARHGELDQDDVEFAQMKNPAVPIESVLSRLVGDGELEKRRGIYHPVARENPLDPDASRRSAGIFPFCPATGRFLLGERSWAVGEPGQWAGFGGSLNHGESPQDGAMRELHEETGYDGPLELEEFAPNLFLARVPEEYDPHLNWETSMAIWITLDDAMRLDPLHWGTEALFDFFSDPSL